MSDSNWKPSHQRNNDVYYTKWYPVESQNVWARLRACQHSAKFGDVIKGVTSAARSFIRFVTGHSAVLVLCLGALHAGEPSINPKFPVKGRSSLSPPIVDSPIHECARSVYVYGFIPKAAVQIFANGSELVGTGGNPIVGFAEINLTRPLVLSDAITARQKVGAELSGPSYDAVIVSPYPVLTTPVAGPDVYACGRIVPVGNLVTSTHMEVSDLDATPAGVIGTGEAAQDWEPIATSPLVAGHHVQAVQIACPGVAGKTVTSPPSAPIQVKPEPSPLPQPTVDKPVGGSDVVTMHNLLVGESVEIKNFAASIGDGLATAPDNWASVSPPVPAVASITATPKLCSTGPSSDPVPSTDRLQPPVLGGPICTGSHYVWVYQTVLNANVVLLRGSQIIGYGGAMLGPLKLAVGIGVTLNDGDSLTVVQYIGSVISPPSNQVTVGCGEARVITQHNDNGRTGVNPAETTLTPALVLARGMRVKYTHPVDGAIAAQPLYMQTVQFKAGRASALFVATASNKVYALNANTGAEQWVSTLADSDSGARRLARGIKTTPVIDVANHRMYVLFSTKNQPVDIADCWDSTHPIVGCTAYEDQLASLDVAYWLVALDYRDGSEQSRVRLSASLFRSNGTLVNFVDKNQNDRTALLLSNGSIYVAFAMRYREEVIEYHGWVLRYRASNLAFQGAFNTSRNATVPTSPFTYHIGEGAGIWQGGGGLTSDADGNVYFLTGNAHTDTKKYSYGDAFIKLTPSGGSMSASWFIPSGDVSLAEHDADLGAGGTMEIPGTNFVIGGGKTGYMYLLDRSTMSLVQRITASTNQYHPSSRDDDCCSGPHLHGSPTYWRGPDSTFGYLYVWGEKDVLRLYRFNTTTGMIEVSAHRKGVVQALEQTMPGGMISISANGNAHATGIVWATLPASDAKTPYPGHLYAFDAENLQPLWDTGFSSMGQWLEPTIGGGKVFVGTSSNEVIAYELAPQGAGKKRWTPFQPQGIARTPLSSRYPDEESIRMMPVLALEVLQPPPGHVKYSVLTGNGVDLYEAQESQGKLVWVLVGSAGEFAPAAQTYRAKVQLSLDGKWSASDGSTAVAKSQIEVPAPEKTDARWLLLKANNTGGRGILTDISYAQRAFTDGGAPPATPPERIGAQVRAPYHAQYILFRAPRSR